MSKGKREEGQGGKMEGDMDEEREPCKKSTV